MALFGAIAAHRLETWLRHRKEADRQALMLLPVVLVLQVAADLATPSVSLAGHASGFVAGLLIGAALSLVTRRSSSASAAA